MNKLNTNKENEKAPKEKKVRKPSRLRREITSVITGEAFARENIVANLSFMFYLTFLLVAYIGYGYYTSRTSRTIYQLEAQKRDLQSEIINEQANLNLVSMQSQIADSTMLQGLSPSVEPPVKIIVQPTELAVSDD